jgi:hypothetical protein
VTGITGVLDKPALPWAAAKETALWALHHRDDVANLGEQPWLDAATRAHRDVWNSKRDRGTNLHGHAEQLIRTGYTDAPAEQLALVESAADFLDRWDVQPVWTETSVYHDVYTYAGRLDLIAELGDGLAWLLDFKTGSGVYPEMALQAAGYRFATHLVAETDAGTHDVDMPPVDRVGIVHVRPDGWDLHPITAGDAEFAAFLACKTAFHFTKRDAGDLVSAPLPHPEVA